MTMMSSTSTCVRAATTPDDQCDEVVAGADRRPNKQRLKIVSFNLYWMFLEDWMTGIKPDGPWATKAQAEAHGKGMAAQLDALDADILIALETENCYTLQRVRAQMKTGSQYKVFFIQGKDSSTGQDVLMMTRVDPDAPVTRTDTRSHYPLAGSNCGWKDEGDSGLSKNLEARFTIPGLPPIYMLAVHLVARPTDPERCAQREAQATVMRDLIRMRAGATSDVGIVVLGDFNDWDDTVVDADESKPNSHVLSIVKSATVPPLVATSSYAAQADRWTHCSTYCNKPVCSALDHILVNDKLLGYAADIAYEMRNRTKQCVGDKPSGSSDHWPVIITLYACAPGDAGCACAEDDKCNAGLACSSEGCVHADSCSDTVPQSSQCPCAAPGKQKRAAEQAAAKLVLTGAIDGPLTGGLPKVVEMYAIEGGSVSSYGLGVGVNGGGSSGAQYALPSDGTAKTGQYLYAVVKGGEAEIRTFLGHDADYVASISSFNGDDAILLYKDGAVFDSLGDATYSDTTPSFAFDDGYIVRKNCTAASTSFRISDWLPRRRVWPSGSSVKSNADAGANRFPASAFKAANCDGSATTTGGGGGGATTAKPLTPTPTAAPGKCLDLLTCSSAGVCECKKGERGCGCIDGEDCDSGLVCRSTRSHGVRCFVERGNAAPAVRSLHWMWYVVMTAVPLLVWRS